MYADKRLAARGLARRERQLHDQELQQTRSLVITAILTLPIGYTVGIGKAQSPHARVGIEESVPRKGGPANNGQYVYFPFICPIETLGDVDLAFELQRNRVECMKAIVDVCRDQIA